MTGVIIRRKVKEIAEEIAEEIIEDFIFDNILDFIESRGLLDQLDSGGGPGFWAEADEYHPSEFSKNFEEQGRDADHQGKVYAVKDPSTGRAVKFDHYNTEHGALGDSKAQFPDTGNTPSPEALEARKAKLSTQVERQIRAANGTPIEWEFPHERGRKAAQEFFDSNPNWKGKIKSVLRLFRR